MMMNRPKPKTKFVYKEGPKFTSNERNIYNEMNDPKFTEQREV